MEKYPHMKIRIIGALDEIGTIGINNTIPWRLKSDMERFKELTVGRPAGRPVIMGRTTFESIFDAIGQPLPERQNIIMTRQPTYHILHCSIAHSLAKALEIASQHPAGEVFICGGSEVYREALDVADTMYLTRVHTMIPQGNAFFPSFDKSLWKLTESEPHQIDQYNQYAFTFETWIKK